MTWKEEITLVVPCKLESQDRIENLAAFLSYAKQISSRPVTVVECDVRPKAYPHLKDLPHVRYMFVQTESPGFWSRSLPINQGAMWAATELVAPWDIDVIIDPQHVEETARAILERRADWGVPFTKLHAVAHEVHREVQAGTFTFDGRGPKYLHTIVGGDHFGAANIFKREVFHHVRGMSERHIGWGSEDAEMGARMQTLGFTLFRHPGPAWHIDHQREPTTSRPQMSAIERNIEETRKVESMNAAQIREHYGIAETIGDYLK